MESLASGELPLFFFAEDYFGKEDSNLHGGDGGKNVHDDVLLYEKYGCEDEDGNRPCYDFVPARSLFQKGKGACEKIAFKAVD